MTEEQTLANEIKQLVSDLNSRIERGYHLGITVTARVQSFYSPKSTEPTPRVEAIVYKKL